jgi:hypothetical protein
MAKARRPVSHGNARANGARSASHRRQAPSRLASSAHCEGNGRLSQQRQEVARPIRAGRRSPRSWTSDPDRCRAAGLGGDTVLATKPDLARTMIKRFLDAGHHVGWVTGDEVYGGNPRLRAALEERGSGYVLAVACSAEVPTGAGKFRADALVQKVPRRAWPKLSAGARREGAAVLRLGRHRPRRGNRATLREWGLRDRNRRGIAPTDARQAVVLVRDSGCVLSASRRSWPWRGHSGSLTLVGGLLRRQRSVLVPR